MSFPEGGSATAGDDFKAISGFSITLPAGRTRATGRFDLVPVNDNVPEEDEFVHVIAELGVPGQPGHVPTVGWPMPRIFDDDIESKRFVLSASPREILEDGGAQAVTVTARLDAAARTAPTSVTVAVDPLNQQFGRLSSPGSDFATNAPVTITIAQGQLSGQTTVTVTPVDDSLAEGPETVVFEGSAPGLSGLPKRAPVTIVDNERASTRIELSATPTGVAEGAEGEAVVRLRAQLDGDEPDDPIKIRIRATGGSAVAGEDYLAGPPRGEPFVAGIDFEALIGFGDNFWEGSLRLRIEDDNRNERPESIQLEATAEGLAAGRETITITDNDSPSSAILLSLSPPSVAGVGHAPHRPFRGGAERRGARVGNARAGRRGDRGDG